MSKKEDSSRKMKNVTVIKPLEGNSAVIRVSVSDGRYMFLTDTGSGFTPVCLEFSMCAGG